MTQLPFMPVSVTDLSNDTTDLSAEEFGAYFRILMRMWTNNAELPADDRKLARIAGLTPAKWRRVKGEIWHFFFYLDESRISQKRLKMEHEKLEQKRARLAINGSKGGLANALKTKKSELAKAVAIERQKPKQTSGKRSANFEVIDNTASVTGNLEMVRSAKEHIDNKGPNAALTGTEQGTPSGRAILANQSGGQMRIARLTDRHRKFKRRVHRGVWGLVRQFKKAEWWVRVTDNEDNVKFVGFNRPVTLAEKAFIRPLREQGIDDAEIQQFMSEIVQQGEVSIEQLEEVVEQENVPAEMDMDVTLREIPDVANVQEEQFSNLTSLAQAGVVFPPEIYLRASQLRNKEELIETLRHQSPESSTITIGGTPAEGDTVYCQLERDTADTLSDDAQVIGVLVIYTTNAARDD